MSARGLCDHSGRRPDTDWVLDRDVCWWVSAVQNCRRDQFKSSSRKKSRVGIYIKSVLQRKVVLSFDLLGGNLKKNLLVSLQNNLEGKCSTEGYIKKKSIQVISYSAGVIEGSHVNFVVSFECLICKPCEGMLIKCLVKPY